MTNKTAARLAWSIVALSLVAMLAITWLAVRNGPDETRDVLVAWGISLLFFTIGGLVASRFPANAIGWIFIAVAFLQVLENLSYEYALYSLTTRGGVLPGSGFAAWVSFWAWMPSIGLLTTFLFLLFPNGRLPSRGWRWAAWASGAGIALVVVGSGIGATSLTLEQVVAELGDVVFPSAALVLAVSGAVLVLVGALASVASLVVRFRRARGDERQQLKWIAYASVFAVISIGIQFLPGMTGEGPFESFLGSLIIVGFLLVPVAAGIGILKHRLFDIDVVINRTVLYGLLAVLITAVYLGVVVGIGTLVGSRGNLVLSIVATALIALGFQPLRQQAQHLANRLVYGKRATPYELLAEFAGRAGRTYSVEDVLPRMARAAAEGTGAARASVWLRVGDRLHRAAVWPESEDPVEDVPAWGMDLPDLPGEDRTFSVRHEGGLLGALGVRAAAAEPLTPAKEKLLEDLAGQAGLILRNVRLTEELRANLEELRASRQRIVAAQDQERRRLERNIHDGAQQQLVALSVNLSLARRLTEKDPARAAEMLDRLRDETQDALENLRDLARGIYPPLLADKGLGAALEAQARKAAVPVTVDPDGAGRYPQEVEAGVYFCVLEALQNVTKYAEASHVTVRLGREDGELVFTVADDGKGFDPATTAQGSGLQNMRDRLEALGGSVDIKSTPGAGTTVAGRIPVGDQT